MSSNAETDRSEFIKLLKQVGLDDVSHFGRPLSAHLLGTHDLLLEWQNPRKVCLAGLFHSVYGTKTFYPTGLETMYRPQLQELIGREAENLVYIFGLSDRKRLLLENQKPPYFWINYLTDERSEIEADVLNNLVEIEIANFIEQLPYLNDLESSVFNDMRTRFSRNLTRMSKYAVSALGQLF